MTPEKLTTAEQKAKELLDELNSVERALSGLSPADPKRVELKNRKADILPRYRGAKENVKNLRRIMSASGLMGATPATSPETMSKRDDLLLRLYTVLALMVDRHRETTSSKRIFKPDELDVVEEFLDHMEPSVENS